MQVLLLFRLFFLELYFRLQKNFCFFLQKYTSPRCFTTQLHYIDASQLLQLSVSEAKGYNMCMKPLSRKIRIKDCKTSVDHNISSVFIWLIKWNEVRKSPEICFARHFYILFTPSSLCIQILFLCHMYLIASSPLNYLYKFLNLQFVFSFCLV